MEFIQGHCKLQTCLNSGNIFHGESSSNLKAIQSLRNQIISSKSTVDATDDAKAIAACKSHSEAERRRRKRINGHLATLRTLLPNTIKTDKATLLAEVVQHVMELKKITTKFTASRSGQHYLFPSETDELNLSYIDHEEGIIKASISCDDRPKLILELTEALTTIHAKVVRVEMATVGGRINIVLWVQISLIATRDEGLSVLWKALYVVINRATLLYSQGNKRPCLSYN